MTKVNCRVPWSESFHLLKKFRWAPDHRFSWKKWILYILRLFKLDYPGKIFSKHLRDKILQKRWLITVASFCYCPSSEHLARYCELCWVLWELKLKPCHANYVCACRHACPLSCVVTHRAPPSTEFPRQEYWSVLPFPSPGDLAHTGIKPTSPAWQILYHWATWEAHHTNLPKANV